MINRISAAVLGQLPAFAADPLGFAERHGVGQEGPAALRLGPRPAFLVATPAAARHVLVDRRDRYGKGAEQARLRPLFGDGMVTASGRRWEASRAASKVGFSQAGVAQGLEYALAAMAEAVPSLVVRAGQAQDLHELLGRLTLRMVVAALFEVRLGASETDRLHAAGKVAHRRLSDSMWRILDMDAILPTREGRAFRAAVAELERQAAVFAREPKGLLAAMAPLAEEFGPAVLRDEAITMVVAGFETTATAACWAAYALACRPDLAGWLRQEAEGESVRGWEERPAQLRRLQRARAFVQEVLRLYPSAWWFARSALVDDVVEGVPVPKGSSVLICPWALHRQPALWPDPGRLDPGRFMGQAPDKFAYLPFGAGPRACVGAQLALAEVTAIVAMLASTFDLEPLSGPLERQAAVGGVTLGVPEAGLRVRMHVRSPMREAA